MQKIFDKTIRIGIGVIFLFIVLFYVICQFEYSIKYDTMAIIIFSFFIIVFYALVYFILQKFFKNKDTLTGVFIVLLSFFIYCFWCWYSKSTPTSDYEVLIDGARSINNGTFRELSHDKENYFYFYNFQTGYVLYLAFVLKIVRDSIIGLKISEIIIMSLTNFIIYRILIKYIDAELAALGAVSYLLFSFNIAGSSIINNQHISTLTIIICIFFLIDDKWRFSKVLVGVFLGFSYIFRQSSIIYVIAIICIYIVMSFAENFRNSKKYFIEIIQLIVGYVVIIYSFDFIVKSIDLVPVSAISGNLKYFKFILGIQSEGITGSKTESARKTQIYFDLKYYGFDYSLYNEECRSYLVKKYTTETKDVLGGILDKIKIFVSNPDNQISYLGSELKRSDIDFINIVGLCQYYISVLITLILNSLVLFNIKKAERHAKEEMFLYFLQISFIGFFIVHLFIEVQTRYRYDQYMLLVFLIFTSLDMYIKKIKEKRRGAFRDKANEYPTKQTFTFKAAR